MNTHSQRIEINSQRNCYITKLKDIGTQQNPEQDGKLNSVEYATLCRLQFLTEKKKNLQKVFASNVLRFETENSVHIA
jgi:hypothetical protein